MIVTCYDDRVVPEVFFEMTPGNTLVYRNSGGRTATDTGVLKAALVSQFLTHINEIVVVHHTSSFPYTYIWSTQLITTRLRSFSLHHGRDIDWWHPEPNWVGWLSLEGRSAGGSKVSPAYWLLPTCGSSRSRWDCSVGCYAESGCGFLEKFRGCAKSSRGVRLGLQCFNGRCDKVGLLTKCWIIQTNSVIFSNPNPRIYTSPSYSNATNQIICLDSKSKQPPWLHRQ